MTIIVMVIVVVVNANNLVLQIHSDVVTISPILISDKSDLQEIPPNSFLGLSNLKEIQVRDALNFNDVCPSCFLYAPFQFSYIYRHKFRMVWTLEYF